MQDLDRQDIAWQTGVIRQSTVGASRPGGTEKPTLELWDMATAAAEPGDELFLREVNEIADELADFAVRRGAGAAWIGLDWLGESDMCEFMLLGPDLYNGVSGIGTFLAAHAAVTGSRSSADLALVGVAHLRKTIKGRNVARFARSLGIGGIVGLASIVYGLSIMGACLGDISLQEDALVAAELVTDDVIAADKLLDVLGGSAGAIPVTSLP